MSSKLATGNLISIHDLNHFSCINTRKITFHLDPHNWLTISSSCQNILTAIPEHTRLPSKAHRYSPGHSFSSILCSCNRKTSLTRLCSSRSNSSKRCRPVRGRAKSGNDTTSSHSKHTGTSRNYNDCDYNMSFYRFDIIILNFQRYIPKPWPSRKFEKK